MQGYKENMKVKAFSLIDRCAHSLQLHEHVVLIAKEMFAKWRDLREAVTQFMPGHASRTVTAKPRRRTASGPGW